MALRGYELILFVRAQNQASGTLRRVANDIRALGKVTDAQARASRIAAREAESIARQASLQRDLESLQTGGRRAAMDAKWRKLDRQRVVANSAIATALENQNKIERQMGSTLDKMVLTEQKINNLQAARGAITDKQVRDVKNMNDAIRRQEGNLGNLNTKLQDQKRILKGIQRDLADPDIPQEAVPDLTTRKAIQQRAIQDTEDAIDRVNSSIGGMRDKLAEIPRAAERALNNLDTRLQGLNRTLQDQVGALDDHRAAMRRAGVAADLARMDYDALNETQKTLIRQEADMVRQIDDTKRAIGEETLVQQQLTQARKDHIQMMKMEALQRQALLGRTISHVGRMAQFGGVIGTALLGGAAQSAASFDTLVTQAATQTRNLGSTGEEIRGNAKEIREEILNMSKAFPASAEEMADSAYDIFSSMNFMKDGIVDVGAGLNFLGMANQVAVAGQTNLKDATNGLITIFNSFGKTLGTPTETLDTMFNIIRFGRVRLAELNKMMIKVAPASRIAGQSLDDVAAALSLLTTRIPSTSVVATGFSRMLEMLQHPDTVKGLRKMGVDITKNGKALLPFNEVMEKIVAKFPELERGGLFAQNFFRIITAVARTKVQLFDAKGNVRDVREVLKEINAAGKKVRVSPGIFGTAEGRRAFNTTVTNMKEFRDLQDQVADKQGVFKIMLDEMMQTPEVRWKIFLNTLRAFILEIGESAIPVFEKLGGYLNKFLRWIDGLDEGIKRNIGKWSLWAAVIAIIGGTLLSIGGAIIALIANFRIATAEVDLFRAALKLTALVSLFFLVKEITDIQTAIAVATAAWLLFRTNGIIAAYQVALANRTAAEKVKWAWTKALVRTGWGAILVAAGFAIDYIINHIDQFRAVWAATTATLPIMWANATAIIRANWDDTLIYMANQTGSFLQSVGGWLSKVPGLAGDVGKLLKGAGGLGKAISGQFKTDFSLPKEVTGPFMKAYNKELERIKKSHKNGALSQKDYLAGFTKTWKAMQGQVTKLIEDGKLQEVQDLLDGIAGAGDGAGNSIKDAAKAANEELDQAASNLMNIYQELRDQNASIMGELFGGEWMTGPFAQEAEEWGVPLRAKDLKIDLQQQIAAFRKFQAGMNTLRQRGVPEALLAEIRQMDPKMANEVMAALSGGSKKEIAEIVRLYKLREKEIDKQTKIDFNKKLAMWKQHGKDIMWALINGLRSENVALENYFRDLIRVWFPNYVKEQVAAANAGLPQVPTTPTAGGGGGGNNSNNNSNNHTTNVNVYGQPAEKGTDTQRRAINLWKNASRAEAERWGITERTPNKPRGKPRGGV